MSGSGGGGDQGRDLLAPVGPDIVGSRPSGPGTAPTINPDFIQAFQNFQLPAGAEWQTAPTMQTLLSGAVPSIQSIDPSLYAGAYNTQNPQLTSYTDPVSGQTVPVNPWTIDPASEAKYAPLIVSPAEPAPGGTMDLKAGTYTDPTNLSGGAFDAYNFNLGSGTATPTEQSMYNVYENIIKNQMSPAMSLLTELPIMAFSALAPELGGALLGAAAGAAGAGAGAGGLSLGSLGTNLLGQGSLLGQGLNAAGQLYQQVSPIISAAKDVRQIVQALNPPRAET
jgi:hypothetical protein